MADCTQRRTSGLSIFQGFGTSAGGNPVRPGESVLIDWTYRPGRTPDSVAICIGNRLIASSGLSVRYTAPQSGSVIVRFIAQIGNDIDIRQETIRVSTPPPPPPLSANLRASTTTPQVGTGRNPYKDTDGVTDLSFANKGEIAKFKNPNWIKQPVMFFQGVLPERGEQGFQGIYRITIYRAVDHGDPAPAVPSGGSVSEGVLTAPTDWSETFPSEDVASPATRDVYESFASFDPATGSLGAWAEPFKIDVEAGPTGPAGPRGPQGLQGATGPRGAAGATGATGPQGIQGAKGDKGDKGDQGDQGPYRFNVYRVVNRGASVPATPTGGSVSNGVLTAPANWSTVFPSGDIHSATRDVYQAFVEYNPSSGSLSLWSAPFRIDVDQGPPGPAGPAGATGPAGPAGSRGSAGPQGPIGPVGPQGATGPQGPAGVGGGPGGDGDSLSFGTAFPSSPSEGDVFVFTADVSGGEVVTLTYGSTNAVSGRLRLSGTTQNLATGTSGTYTVPGMSTAGSRTYTYEAFSGANFTGDVHISTITIVWS